MKHPRATRKYILYGLGAITISIVVLWKTLPRFYPSFWYLRYSYYSITDIVDEIDRLSAIGNFEDALILGKAIYKTYSGNFDFLASYGHVVGTYLAAHDAFSHREYMQSESSDDHPYEEEDLRSEHGNSLVVTRDDFEMLKLDMSNIVTTPVQHIILDSLLSIELLYHYDALLRGEQAINSVSNRSVESDLKKELYLAKFCTKVREIEYVLDCTDDTKEKTQLLLLKLSYHAILGRDPQTMLNHVEVLTEAATGGKLRRIDLALAYYLIAVTYTQNGDYAEASQYLERSVEQEPRFYSSLHLAQTFKSLDINEKGQVLL